MGQVHLHLEHPLVKRLLNRFLVRGFQSNELTRAAVITTNDNSAKLILLARLSLYGHGASRLHDEMLELVAEWDPNDVNRKLRVLNPMKTNLALNDLETNLRQGLPEVDPTIQTKLREFLPTAIIQLKDKLESRALECSERAKSELEKRANIETNAFIKVLQDQRNRILKTRKKHDTNTEQLVLSFADQELRQLRLNRSYWDKRLKNIDLGKASAHPAAFARSKICSFTCGANAITLGPAGRYSRTSGFDASIKTRSAFADFRSSRVDSIST